MPLASDVCPRCAHADTASLAGARSALIWFRCHHCSYVWGTSKSDRNLRRFGADRPDVVYARDDTRRRTVITISGAVARYDLLAIALRCVGEFPSHYAALLDARGARALLSDKDMQLFADFLAAMQFAKRGPLAIVTTDLSFFRTARRHLVAALKPRGLHCDVFTDTADADGWLDRQQQA